jgi:ABC-type Fe3+ transport system permease subunit
MLSLLSVAICLPAGVVIAAAFVRLGMRGMAILPFLLATIVFVPVVVQAGGWISIVGPYGFIQPADWGLGVGVRTGWPAMLAVIFIHAVASLPWVVGILAGSLWSQGIEEEEWGLTCGGIGSVLRRVMAPMHRDGLVLAIFVVVTTVWTDMSVTDLFAVRTLAEEIYTEIEGGARSSLVLPISAIVGGSLAIWASRATRRQLDRPGLTRTDSTWRGVGVQSSLVAIGFKGVALVVLMGVAAPMFGLVRQAFGSTDGAGWSMQGWWMDGGVLVRSVAVAALSSGWATLGGCVGAWWFVHEQGRGRKWLLLVAMVALMIPGPAVGLSIVEMLSRPSPGDLLGRLYDSPLVVAWGQAARAWPWLFLLMAGVMSLYPSGRWERLRLEGASGWMRLRLGPFGEFRWLVMLGFVLGLGISLGELATTKIVSPPGFDTVSAIMFGLLHVGTTQSQARLAIAVWLLAMLLTTAAWLLVRSSGRITAR